MQEIVLSNDLLQIGIMPKTGASLSFFKYKGQDVLRPMNTNDSVQDSNNAALFLMIPFCGRIRGGSFVYWGITRKMKKNQSGITDPIHGDGWKSVWSVDTQTQDSITLKMTHDKATGFPFSYEAGVTYALQGPSLSIEMTVTNRAVLPMPVGMGIHPFFVKTKDIELQYQSKTVWAHESDPIFDRPYQTPENWQFGNNKPLKSMVFDTCFGGFDGRAQLTYPDLGYKVNISADEQFGHIVLYAPKGKNFVCLEPCTNASNAFNLAANGTIGTGIKSIGQNQSLTGKIHLTLTDL